MSQRSRTRTFVTVAGLLAVAVVGLAGDRSEASVVVGSDLQHAANDVVRLPGGDLVLAGWVGPGDSAQDGWLARLGADGLPVWSQASGGPGGADGFRAVTLLADGTLAAVGGLTQVATGDDWRVVRFSSDGTVIADIVLEAEEDDDPAAIAALPDGGLVVVGFTRSFTMAGGDRSAWVVRLDASLAILWQQRYGTDDANDVLISVAVDPAGDLVVAGATLSTGSGSGAAAWLAKLDAGGAPRWELTTDSTRRMIANAVALRPDGRIVVGGTVSGAGGVLDDQWLAALDSDGTLRWSRRLDLGGQERIEDLALAADGGVHAVGSGTDLVFGPAGALVARLSAAGDTEWLSSFGVETNTQGATGVVADEPDGATVVGRGGFPFSVSFGAFVLPVDATGSDGPCLLLTRDERSFVDDPRVMTPWTSERLPTDATALPSPVAWRDDPLMTTDECLACRPFESAPLDGARVCPGDVATLDSSPLALLTCPGGVTREWTDDSGAVVGTGVTLDVMPGETTTYEVTLTCAEDPDCTLSRPVTVFVDRPPTLSAAEARDAASCNLGILLEWSPAAFHGSSGAGVYNLYRSEVSCAEAVTRPPVASGLTDLRWIDTDILPGQTWSYVLEAEDSDAGTACGLAGAVAGGIAERTCLGAVTDVVESAPPAPLGGLLRVSRPAGTVRLDWGSRVLEPGEHFHVLASDRLPGATAFANVGSEGLVATEAFPPPGTGPHQAFLVRIADACEQESDTD